MLLVVLVTVAQWAGAQVHLTHPSIADRRDAHTLSALADSLYFQDVQRHLVMAFRAGYSYLAQTVYWALVDPALEELTLGVLIAVRQRRRSTCP